MVETKKGAAAVAWLSNTTRFTVLLAVPSAPVTVVVDPTVACPLVTTQPTVAPATGFPDWSVALTDIGRKLCNVEDEHWQATWPLPASTIRRVTPEVCAFAGTIGKFDRIIVNTPSRCNQSLIVIRLHRRMLITPPVLRSVYLNIQAAPKLVGFNRPFVPRPGRRRAMKQD
jgi:hypothetical protein